MTRLVRRNYGSGHAYTVDGAPCVGVTTAIGKGVPKPALVNWAAGLVAEAAVEQRDQWESLTPYKAVTWLRNVPNQRRDAMAVRGNQVHAIAQQLMDGKEVDVAEELAGHVDACIRFLTDFAVDVELMETPVAHTGAVSGVPIVYAGTLDLIVTIGGTRWLLDWKTGKGVYGDVALQLAAYRYCDLALVNGAEVALPFVERTGVVHLRADGYDLYPVEAGQQQWRDFLAAVRVARFCDGSRELVGSSLHPEGLAS